MDWNDILDYNGLNLIWRESPANRCAAGSIAGSLTKVGYIDVEYKGRRYLAHRIIWEMHNGEIPEKIQIDHIDGNKSNNKLSNLRLATPQQNQRNRGAYANNTSGFKGVCWDKGNSKWRASYRLNHKTIYIGTYDTAEEASETYIRVTKEIHGDFYHKLITTGN